MNERPETPSPGKGRWGTLVYLVRFMLAAGLLVGLLAIVERGTLHQYTVNHFALTFFVGKLNVYHDVCYALLIGLLLMPIVLWSVGKLSSRVRSIKWPLIGVLAALTLAVGLLPLWFATRYFGDSPLPPAFWLGALYLNLNLIGVLFFEAADKSREKISRGLKKAVGIADCLAPLLVWRAYRRPRNAKTAALFVLPYGLLAAAQFVPWLLDISPANPPRSLPPAYHYISYADAFYQVAIDPADGAAVAADGPNRLRKFDPVTGLLIVSAEVAPHVRDVQGFGIDLPRRELVFADAVAGYTSVFDLGNLQLKRQIRIANPHPPNFRGRLPARTLFDPQTGTLLAFDFLDYAAQLNAAGDQVVAYLSNGIATPYVSLSDFVIDPRRRLIHGVSWKNLLIAWDIDMRQVVRTKELPSIPDRILLDEARGRLIMPLPAPGRLLVVDAETYEQLALIDASFGVRAPALNQKSKRLFLGSIAPYIEIRSLENYALIDRVAAPAWSRWLAVDEAQNRLFVAAYQPGLYWIDLAQLRPGGWLQRSDPFFFLFRKLAGAADWANRYYRERHYRRVNTGGPRY